MKFLKWCTFTFFSNINKSYQQKKFKLNKKKSRQGVRGTTIITTYSFQVIQPYHLYYVILTK